MSEGLVDDGGLQEAVLLQMPPRPGQRNVAQLVFVVNVQNGDDTQFYTHFMAAPALPELAKVGHAMKALLDDYLTGEADA